MATRCRCPPDSVCVALCMNSLRLTSSSAASTAAATCSSGSLYLCGRHAHRQAKHDKKTRHRLSRCHPHCTHVVTCSSHVRQANCAVELPETAWAMAGVSHMSRTPNDSTMLTSLAVSADASAKPHVRSYLVYKAPQGAVAVRKFNACCGLLNSLLGQQV